MTPFDLVFESLPLPAIIHDAHTIIDANRAAADTLGAAEDRALIGLPLSEIIHRDAREAGQVRRAILNEGHTFSGVPTKLRTLSGKTVHVRVTAVPFSVGDRLLSLVVARDVECLVNAGSNRASTPQYSRETSIREAALDALPVPVLLNRGGTMIEYVNPATSRLVKAASPTALIGRSTVDLTHPDVRDLIRTRIALRITGAGRDEEQPIKLRALDGSSIRARLCGHFVEWRENTYGVWVVTASEAEAGDCVSSATQSGCTGCPQCESRQPWDEMTSTPPM